MSIRVLIFLLFLYDALIWVYAAYRYSGAELQKFGLFWTAVGLLGLFLLVVGSWLLGWVRIWRARAAVRPPAGPVARPQPVVHEDDAALAALLAEANATLSKSPSHSAVQGKRPIAGLPLYLLVGPAGSGKTSTFVNCGLEPQLLAGQVAGTAPVVPTRLANIWLANGAVFVEVSGRIFTGDPARWKQFLVILRGSTPQPFWRRLLGATDEALRLRGVLSFCDVKDLIAATSDSQQLERQCRDWHDRLLTIGEVFQCDFPVYQVIAKSDAIRYSPEYFRRISESEVDQIFGCTWPRQNLAPAPPAAPTIEAEARRLIASFRTLYNALAERRLGFLANEPDPAQRPAIYEFPREFKRIRSQLIQFLSEVFRPHPLRLGPVFRGYYLTATRETETVLSPAGTGTDWDFRWGTEATRLFRTGGTQLLSPDLLAKEGKPKGRAAGMRWIFTAELFRHVIFQDSPVSPAPSPDPRIALYRRAGSIAACCACGLLCLAFLISWTGNRRLLADVASLEAPAARRAGRALDLRQLQALEALRVQVARLSEYDRGGPPLHLRWGLYSGERLLARARENYFRNFQQMILQPLNAVVTSRLASLPADAGPDDPYDPIANLLKVHLMVSSGSCTPETPLVSATLKQSRPPAGWPVEPASLELLNRQIDFYAGELPRANPCPLPEDAQARDQARRYLGSIKGVDRIYRGILAKAAQNGKAQRLADFAPAYKQVLTGAEGVNAAFTAEGWAFVQKAAKDGGAAGLGEACVLGPAAGAAAGPKPDRPLQDAILRLYIRDYIEHWRNYVAGFSVMSYGTTANAARKLELLSGHNSPLLALFAMTGTQTNFPAQEADRTFVEQAAERIKKGLGGDKKTEKAAAVLGVGTAVSSPSPTDITRAFQPVHAVVTPGGTAWIEDKNKAYMAALGMLQASMEEIARAGANPDPALFTTANQNADKAREAARQIAQAFQAVAVGGLDTTVERLLEEPVERALPLLRAPDLATGVNQEFRNLCSGLQGVTQKYPFRSELDRGNVTLAELAAWFAPDTGKIWAFRAKTLGELTVRQGAEWKAKDPAKKPELTPGLLEFLNRSQRITDAFFAAGAGQPHLTFIVRPRLDGKWKDGIFSLEAGGQNYSWNLKIQQPFTWPGPAGNQTGARAWVNLNGVPFPVASREGLWGIFRIMADAEPRALGDKVIVWKKTRPGGGRIEEFPPVQIEIVEFPGGVDVFNPRFFAQYGCPAKAVQ